MNKQYSIILVDPPWPYDDASRNRIGARKHYSCMELADIYGLRVQRLCKPDCVLFLWATWPMLIEALHTITYWGFEYKTLGFIWVKHSRSGESLFFGAGHYTHGNTEPCLLAVKGEKLKRVSSSVPQVVVASVQEHSHKPIQVYEAIETLYGEQDRVELFGRCARLGWDCISSLEVGGKDIRTVL